MNEQTSKRANEQRADDSSPSDFRKQMLWLKAQDFAERIAAIVVRLPSDRAADAIGNQLVRAAGSIAANIAEGYGRYSQGAYRNHLSIARGSAFESESWLDLLVRRNYLTEDVGEALLQSCIEIQKLVTYRMKSLPDGRRKALHDERATYEA